MSSVLSNLFSVAVVILVALLMGFSSSASLMAWLLFGGMLLLLTTALTWLAMFFGLLAKSAEGAGAFSYILLFMVFVSSAFTPTNRMSAPLRAFANNQPLTPIIQTMRSLLVHGTAGSNAVVAITWCAGLLIVSYLLAIRAYKNKAV